MQEQPHISSSYWHCCWNEFNRWDQTNGQWWIMNLLDADGKWTNACGLSITSPLTNFLTSMVELN